MRNVIGQYMPLDSPIHRLDPRLKVVAVLIYMVLAFIVRSIVGYAILGFFLLLFIKLSNIKIGTVLKSIKPIMFIIVFTLVINLFFNATGTPVFELWIIKITDRGIITAVKIAVRLVFLLTGTSMLTLTTTTVDLTDAMERLMKPFKLVKFPVHELAMMMTIALRFIPALTDETDRIMKAQKARGASFDEGNIISRAKAMVPLIVPLFVSAFRIATDLAIAMESRCYHGGEGRTRMKVLHMKASDYIGMLIFAVFTGLIIADAAKLFYWSNEWLVSLLGWKL